MTFLSRFYHGGLYTGYAPAAWTQDKDRPMTTAMTVPTIDAALVERVLIHGDLRQLTPAQKVSYYNAVCEAAGLNPITQPFAYLVLSNREVLYAKREATEQLRFIHSVSIDAKNFVREVIEGIYVVTAPASLPSGRTDVSTGAVSIEGLKGEARANAMMKAETKAKRRVTLSICGLGMLDETEVETIPGATTHEPMIQIKRDTKAEPAIPTMMGRREGGVTDAPGTLGLPAQSTVIIDTEHGELPPGFALIDDVKPDGNWWHIVWGKDVQGGARIFKTKIAKIANLAKIAFEDGAPVRLHAKKFPFLDEVERLLDDGMTAEELAATKWHPDENVPFTRA
jgi:hypothetical protein